MRKLLIVFIIMLTSIVCHAVPYDADTAKINELHMELKAVKMHISEIESYHDSIDSELRKVDAIYDASHPKTSSIAIGAITIVLIFGLGVYLILKK